MAADEDNASASKGGAAKRPRRSRPPVTIDLEARAVETPAAEPAREPEASEAAPAEATAPAEAAAAAILGGEQATAASQAQDAPKPQTPPPSRQPPPVRPAGNWVGLFAAGLVGGLIVLLFGYGLLATGVGSNNEANEIALARVKGVQDTVEALGKRVAAVEARPMVPADLAARLDGVAGRIDGLESAAATVARRLDTVESGIAALPAPPAAAPQSLAATSRVLDDLMQRLDALESAAGSGDADMPAILGDRVTALETATAVLSGRLDALADQMQAIAAKPQVAVDSEKAARAVAIGTLRQAAERGGGFAADLAMIEALGIDPVDVASLRPLAAKGAPATATLAAEFPSVADAILAAATAGESGGFIERLIAHARGLVTVRPVGPIAGDSPAAIVSRMQAAVDAGDLAAALKERDGLADPGKAASAVWAERAADRVAIDRLVGRLVAAIGAPQKAD